MRNAIVPSAVEISNSVPILRERFSGMQQSEDLRAELETVSSIIRILTKRDYETLLKFPAVGTFEKLYQTNYMTTIEHKQIEHACRIIVRF